METKKHKVIVGLSGGVDSAVAAYLLKKEGYDVHAVFMKNFSERVGKNHECPWKEDRLEAYRVAAFFKIPITTWNFEKEYADRVLKYMYAGYRKGRTPNPDIMCNKQIKFRTFLDRARISGAQFIATGHYATIQRDKAGTYHLLKARDKNKDQSYFLSTLDQSQLRHVLFPLASYTKPQVRGIAKRIGLPNATRPDSQGICFVGNVSMTEFLKKKIKPKQGNVVDTQGNILGHHQGVYYYTIGQRKGIQVGGGPALYVIGKDVKRNRLTVGTQDQLELFRSEIIVSDWCWVAEKHPFPMHCTAQIRYRQDAQRVVLKKKGTMIMAIFSRPQRAVSAGQTLVAYKGLELIGSGIIAG